MRLYWSISENVPVISKECSRSDLRIVPTSKTSDPRPATRWDLDLLRKVVDEQFGAGTFNELLPRSQVVLMGRVPYMDSAYEIIADGSVLGHLFFDIYEFKWYFKPLEASIQRIGHRMEILRKKAYRGEELGMASHEDPKFILLENGLAERIEGKYIVTRIFKNREAPLDNASKWNDVVSINEPCILAMESRSIRFIWRISKRGNLIVSFSGGKDSSALLELVNRSDVAYHTYFNDTGLELPETIEFVEKIGYDIKGEGDSFWRYVSKFGPPARDYRWCCKVLKLTPTRKALKYLAPGVTLVGQRKYESSARMRSRSIWKNRWLPEFVTGAPLNDWSSLQTWIYIMIRRVRTNPLYEGGFERLGCYLCPASRLSDYRRIEERYPDLWYRWKDFLSRYAARMGYGECWLRYGLWRWINPPERMRSLCSVERKPLMTAVVERNALRMDPYNKEMLLSLALSIGRVRGDLVSGKRISFITNVEDIRFEGDLSLLIKVGIRSVACAGCGVCKEYCDNNAILLIDGKARIDPSRCISCGICNDICPLSFYAGKIVRIKRN